jgi:hypothetical protein
MSWTRGLLAALAVGALLGGSAGCDAGGTREHGREGGTSASPAGTLLDHTDEEGRHYREVDEKDAPQVGVEVQPDPDDSWSVRLTVRNFRFSPPGSRPVAVTGRGVVQLYLDGHDLARLRTLDYRLPGRLVPRGTHHVTARLYADDDTVWAVDGKPVESTADITASGAGTEPPSTATIPPAANGGTNTALTRRGRPVAPGGALAPVSVSAWPSAARTDGRGSPDPAGKA